MKYNRIIIFFITIFFFSNGYLSSQTVRQEKLTDFKMQSSVIIKDSGSVLSSSEYQSDKKWFSVQVPSTVLTGLVANSVYPNPYMGLNNMQIPDACRNFNKKYNLDKFSYLPGNINPWESPYWYRTSFTVPISEKGQTFNLIFKGINYRASVWLNGNQIADSTDMVGMFSEYCFNVTSFVKIGEKNNLAVKIYPLDYPGEPDTEQLDAMGPFYLNGGPTGDIGKNVTMLCSVGWDWMPPVRDRNMGIWQPVYLRVSGPVTISRSHLITDLPELPDTSVANISLETNLKNNTTEEQQGVLHIIVSPESFTGKSIHFSKLVNVKPNKSVTLKFNPSNEEKLCLKNPHLWWPNGHGEASLYRLRMKYEIGNTVSDDTSFVFGIRTVSSTTVEVKGKYLRRDFYVNGKRVNLVGGAWVPDMMVDRDSIRYDRELRLCQNGNINIVRIWGGGITPPDDFFNAADRYGMLIWSDFWITGDTNGEFKGSSDWPLESDVFIKNMTSTIYRIRNHPSLLVWTGGNEGHARKELFYAMRDSVIKLDGIRPFITCSSGFSKLPEGWKSSWPDNKPSGVYSGGPYSWKDPKVYYSLADTAKDWVFKDETGIPSQPPYHILSKIISDLKWDKSLPYPLNNTWGYHDAAKGNGRYDLYYSDMVKRYGQPTDLKEFSDKMQLMNAVGYQAIFESAGSRLKENGGVMLWKLNAAFPSVIWQVYDWYMEPNAGYYFMQDACEPVHVQFNQDDQFVAVVNRSYKSLDELHIVCDVFSVESKLIYHTEKEYNIDAESVGKVFCLSKILSKIKDVSFIILRMKNKEGCTISKNVYWLSPDNNFESMNKMKTVKIKSSVIKKVITGKYCCSTIKLTNISKQLAFFIHPMLMNDKEEVLPSFWSDNYFSLKPGETNVISVKTPILKGKESFCIDGWNVKKIIIN